jgi:hypothetical protein
MEKKKGYVKEEAARLYDEFVNSLDEKKPYSMPEFNLLLTEFLKERTDNNLIIDAVWDIKDVKMMEEGGPPQHSSY